MYKTIVAVLLLAAVASGQLVGWRNCGSPMGTVHRIRITGCSQTPCGFAVGQTVHIEVDATSQSNSVNLPFALTTSFLGLPITLHEGNACQYLIVGGCPALTGSSFTFQQEYTVPDIIPPGVNSVVTSTLWNDFGDVAICIQVDSVIVPRPANEISA